MIVGSATNAKTSRVRRADPCPSGFRCVASTSELTSGRSASVNCRNWLTPLIARLQPERTGPAADRDLRASDAARGRAAAPCPTPPSASSRARRFGEQATAITASNGRPRRTRPGRAKPRHAAEQPGARPRPSASDEPDRREPQVMDRSSMSSTSGHDAAAVTSAMRSTQRTSPSTGHGGGGVPDQRNGDGCRPARSPGAAHGRRCRAIRGSCRPRRPFARAFPISTPTPWSTGSPTLCRPAPSTLQARPIGPPSSSTISARSAAQEHRPSGAAAGGCSRPATRGSPPCHSTIAASSRARDPTQRTFDRPRRSPGIALEPRQHDHPRRRRARRRRRDRPDRALSAFRRTR